MAGEQLLIVEKSSLAEERLQAQDALSETLRSLFMVVERYPELRTAKPYRQLQGRIGELAVIKPTAASSTRRR